jgi:hypothetical protein
LCYILGLRGDAISGRIRLPHFELLRISVAVQGKICGYRHTVRDSQNHASNDPSRTRLSAFRMPFYHLGTPFTKLVTSLFNSSRVAGLIDK